MTCSPASGALSFSTPATALGQPAVPLRVLTHSSREIHGRGAGKECARCTEWAASGLLPLPQMCWAGWVTEAGVGSWPYYCHTKEPRLLCSPLFGLLLQNKGAFSESLACDSQHPCRVTTELLGRTGVALERAPPPADIRTAATLRCSARTWVKCQGTAQEDGRQGPPSPPPECLANRIQNIPLGFPVSCAEWAPGICK